MQSQYPDVYKEFFSNNDLIISGHPWFSLHPSNIWHKSTLIRMKYTLPFLWYVWINKIDTPWLHFKDAVSLYQGEVHTTSLESIYPKINKLRGYLQEVLEQTDWWYEISFLTEFWRWQWLWYTWLFTALLAVWLAVQEWLLETEMLDDLHAFESSPLFSDIYYESWKYLMLLKYNDTCWTASLNTLISGDGPIIIEHEMIDPELLNAWTIHDKQYSWENINKKNNPMPPFLLIYSWVGSDSEYLQNTKYDEKETINQLFDEYKENRSEKLFATYPMSIWEWYQLVSDVFSYYTALLSVQLRRLFDKAITKKYVQEYIVLLDNIAKISWLVEPNDGFSASMRTELDKELSAEQYSLFSIYSGKSGGSYILVFDSVRSKKSVMPLIQEFLESTVDASILSDETSLKWVHPWIKIQQYFSNNVYSEFVKQWSMMYVDNQWTSMVWTYDELKEMYKTWFIMDTKNNKVLLNGETLTKKEIKSQTTTIEVMWKLLDNLGKEVNNSVFPPSTYTRQQNQMIWKILGPLRKLSQAYFWKEFPMICSWSLRDFDLTLVKSEIIVWMIKKI